MADQNIKINVSATNQAGVTFQQIRTDLDKLKIELQRPIQGPAIASRFGPAEQAARDRLAGLTRGLQKAAIAAEAKALQRAFLPGGALSASDLIREQNERFRATAGGGPGAARRGGFGELSPEATESISDKYGKLAAKLFALKGILKITEAGIEGLNAVLADRRGDLKKAAEGYISLAESLEHIPIVGSFALKVANKLTGGALEAAKKALADAEDIDKQTAELAGKLRARRERGEQIVAATRGGAASARESLYLSDFRGNDAARAVAEAQLEFGRIKDRLDEEAKKAFDRDLSPAQRLELEQNIAVQRRAATENLVESLMQINLQGMRREGEAIDIHNEMMKRLQQNAAVESLELLGQHNDARLQSIQNQYDNELELLRKRRDAEQENLKPEDSGFTNAEARFAEASAAIEAERARKVAAAWQEESKRAVGEFFDDVEAASAEFAAEQRDAARFQVKGPSPFSGESRLLTGVGSTIDPTLEPVKKTERNTKDQIVEQKKTNEKLDALLAAGALVIIAGPV